MRPAELALAVVAALGVALFDHLIVAAAFLSAPSLGGWLLALGLAGAVAGVVLRRGWLVFAAQNAVIVLSIAHAVRGENVADLSNLTYFSTVILLGNLLVWPVARLAGSRSAGV